MEYKRLKKTGILFLVAALIAAADHIFKLKAEKHPEEFREVVHNKGFAGERLSDKPETVRRVSLLVTLFNFILLPFFPERTIEERMRKAGWLLMAGGGLSNTLDRVFRHYVVDYVRIGRYVYNLGDFSIAAGSALYITGCGMEIPKSGPHQPPAAGEAFKEYGEF